MRDERDDDARMQRILGAAAPAVSAPPFSELHRSRSRASLRSSLAFTLVAVLVAVIALIAGGALSEFRQRQAASSAGIGQLASPTASASAARHVALPPVVARPITRTSAAAQVAWVGTYPAGDNGAGTFVGIDPSGKIVGRLSTGDGPYFRAADGARIFAINAQITSFSALDGKLEHSYGPIAAGRAIAAAFSPDGRWLAIVSSAALVELIDLQTGLTQTTPLGHSANAQHPGLSGNDPNALIWSTVLFSSDSQHVYTLVDWGGPGRITAFDVTATGLVQRASAVDGENGKQFASCGGTGLAARIVGNGTTLVTFCYVDAEISFIDLATLTKTASFRASMANPFWLAPIFTPDDQLLYLHQYAAFGDAMQVVDLTTRTLLGPVPTPTQVSDPGPFAWLFPVVYAGFTPSTIPVSPDGLKMYSVADKGITVLRIPDLKPMARLAADVGVSEVWVSGDGKTLFGTTDSKTIYVIPDDGRAVTKIDLPDQAGYFISPDHG